MKNRLLPGVAIGLGLVGGALTLAAHAGDATKGVAAVDIGIQKGATFNGHKYVGGTYGQVDTITMPDHHTLDDKLIAYEGPGWESDRVGYRLYLDERSVTDVWGKKLPAAVLHTVGRGDNYSVMNDWGMDVLKVGESLGIGGLGYADDTGAHQVGKAQKISADRLKPGADAAGVRVRHNGLKNGEGLYDLTADYVIHAGSRLTHVTAKATGDAPTLATGVVIHDGVTILEGAATDSAWGYVATWGQQSLNNDNLGLVVFYPKDGVAKTDGRDAHTLYITFKPGITVDYAFGAAWELESDGIKTLDGFKAYLEKTAASLAAGGK
ncbi:DUF4861 family protein [Pseudokordiimonas caeni]|uniref:DUF4861 family protein n=1 Tax=Pseudokordiimonas caeni TaxID=2997908 RepID=UPI0028123B6D|nr:DUF4861 family protein [Pseudokordiimonas caeni]